MLHRSYSGMSVQFQASTPLLMGSQQVSLSSMVNLSRFLNTGKGHWVTASSIGVPYPPVHIYDSLYSSAGTALESQIARLIHTQQSSIYLDFMDLPVQAGTQVYTVYYIIYVLIKVR